MLPDAASGEKRPEAARQRHRIAPRRASQKDVRERLIVSANK